MHQYLTKYGFKGHSHLSNSCKINKRGQVAKVVKSLNKIHEEVEILQDINKPGGGRQNLKKQYSRALVF